MALYIEEVAIFNLFGEAKMARPNGREIDPEKVKYQLDMLVTAIWKNAEEQLRARKMAESSQVSEPAHSYSTRPSQKVTP